MMNRQDRVVQIWCHLIMIIIVFTIILPFTLLIISSFTDESAIVQYGYSFFPKKWSLNAYKYLVDQSDFIFNSIKISMTVTALGTSLSMILTCLLAYTLSRKQFPLRRLFSFLVFFTMLFNGGLVPTYLIYTQIFHIKNTLAGLIIPGLLMNGFNVILVRTFFATNIPEAVIESARIDGLGEFGTFVQIVMPLSLPILAALGLMTGVSYWNDWYNGLVYITEPNLFSLQNLLNRILENLSFLQRNSSLGAAAAREIARIPGNTVRMAMAVIGIMPVLMVYPFFQKYFVKGITIGAIKE
ncbi:MAG: carbohydrate ABC transporter permease [Treponema sp.]|jgi:putative aldouronate transport system permease protein|nr:carbohydrate ABC transporter permease [Treponema sp.]